MRIVQEIGSYAGLAAVFGLAVLSALYFSQARDIKRLREWAGRAPERAPGSASVQRVAAQPAGRPQPVAGRAGPQLPPTPGATRAAGAGAASAAAVGPAAATPTAARAAESAQDGEDDEQAPGENAANGGAGAGTNDRPALSQNTVVHPAPGPLDEVEEEDAADRERPEDDLEEDSAELAFGEDEYDEDSGEFAVGEDEYDEDGDWDETGDEPAVSAIPPVAPRPGVPALPARPAPAASARDATPSPTILPPYSESRPGAPAAGGRRSRGGVFASRGRAAGVLAVAVLILAALAFGATQLLGGGGDTAKKSPAGSSQPAPSASGKAKPKKAAGIDPASVRVAVLNGTTVPGLAAQVGDSVEKQGFKLGTVTNFNDKQRAESVVLYAPGAEREAADVGRRLKISQREPIDAESQGVAGDATVVIVTGQDKTQ
jgi:hypothetical protein